MCVHWDLARGTLRAPSNPLRPAAPVGLSAETLPPDLLAGALKADRRTVTIAARVWAAAGAEMSALLPYEMAPKWTAPAVTIEQTAIDATIPMAIGTNAPRTKIAKYAFRLAPTDSRAQKAVPAHPGRHRHA